MNESDANHEHRLGVVAVFVENRLDTAPRVNQILSDYGRILVGRMGIPYHEPVRPRFVGAGRVQSPFSSDESGDSPRERNLSVIAVIVDGSNDEIGAMTGKLGAIPGVSVKAALRRKNSNAECKVQDAKVKMEDGPKPEAVSEKLEARTQNKDAT